MRHFLIWLLLLLYLLGQLLSLPYSPLPWFDETFFAHIARNWWQSGQLMASVAIFEEIKAYGPVYFILTGLSLGVFGFEIWAFRIVNFMFGIANLFWLYQLLKLRYPDLIRARYGLLLPILIDPFYHLSLHEGRMDLVALFFMLGGIYWALRGFAKPRYRFFIYSAMWVSLALLTTPRSGFMLLSLGIVGAVFTFRDFKARWTYALTWALVLMGSYSIWVFYAFGDWLGLWQYYTEANEAWMYQKSLVDLFLGNSGYLPRQSYPIILASLVAVLLHVWAKGKAASHYTLYLSLLNVLFFYLLVYDFGPYSVFLLPFYYFLLVEALLLLSRWKLTLLYLAWLGILALNLSYFSLKMYQIWLSLPQRDHVLADAFIKQHIPAGSRVIGEPMFTYAVLKAGSDYQYMDLYETLESREKRQRESYQYEYIIITEHLAWRKPDIVEYYLSKAKLSLVAELSLPRSEASLSLDKWRLLSSTERSGYSCRLYKRNF